MSHKSSDENVNVAQSQPLSHTHTRPGARSACDGGGGGVSVLRRWYAGVLLRYAAAGCVHTQASLLLLLPFFPPSGYSFRHSSGRWRAAALLNGVIVVCGSVFAFKGNVWNTFCCSVFSSILRAQLTSVCVNASSNKIFLIVYNLKILSDNLKHFMSIFKSFLFLIRSITKPDVFFHFAKKLFVSEQRQASLSQVVTKVHWDACGSK